MHLTRANINRAAPVPRKGTAYVARPLAHLKSSVSVLTAVRDMLHLARDAREVKSMIKGKKLKINGRLVKDCREPLVFLSKFEADKIYQVCLLKTGRFSLEPVKNSARIAKVVNKTTLKGKAMQINFHDGTNCVTKEKISVGDSAEIKEDMTIGKIIPLKENANVVVITGRNIGFKGKISRVENESVFVKIDERLVRLGREQVVAL